MKLKKYTIPITLTGFIGLVLGLVYFFRAAQSGKSEITLILCLLYCYYYIYIIIRQISINREYIINWLKQ